jgi:hypothetical protein
MKALYGVPRVAFLFTGGDHAHAHVVPMHEKTDITSQRYIAEEKLTFAACRVPLPKNWPPQPRSSGTGCAHELAGRRCSHFEGTFARGAYFAPDFCTC